jgi:hypothetical protein
MSDVQLIGHEGARRNAGDRDLRRIDGEGAELVRCVGRGAQGGQKRQRGQNRVKALRARRLDDGSRGGIYRVSHGGVPNVAARQRLVT